MDIIKSIIVATAENNVIGDDNKLLWHIPDDLKRFKKLTSGKVVIMGRKTLDSIVDHLGKPLPNRENIVITRQQSGLKSYDGVHYAHSLEEAIKLGEEVSKQNQVNELFCVGGAQIYEQFFQYCDRIYLTIIQKPFYGDAHFPQIDESDWVRKSIDPVQTHEDLSFNYELWTRK